MKAKWRDLPVEALPHALNWPELWPMRRGRSVEIECSPWPDWNINRWDNQCREPHFLVIGELLPDGLRHVTCPCLIELDESVNEEAVRKVVEEINAVSPQVATAGRQNVMIQILELNSHPGHGGSAV